MQGTAHQIPLAPSPAPPETWELESYPPRVTQGIGHRRGCSGLWHMTLSPPERQGRLQQPQPAAAASSSPGSPQALGRVQPPLGLHRGAGPSNRTNKATASLSGEGASNVCAALAGPRMKCATHQVKGFSFQTQHFPD